MNRLLAILRQRCPICLQGATFRGFLTMHKNCPHCGIVYEREHGYFLNSMFVAYIAGFLILLPSAVWMALTDTSIPVFAIAITLETAVVWPLIFRYSRVIWLHIDQLMDPRSANADKVTG